MSARFITVRRPGARRTRASAGVAFVLLIIVATMMRASADASSSGGSLLRGVSPQHEVWQDGAAYELGVRFTARTDGVVRSIRFYKGGAENAGPHVGSIWGPDGSHLAAVAFTGESTRGWQVALLSRAVPITAGLTYTASYSDPHGMYAVTEQYFAAPLSSGALTVRREGGVFATSPGAFPTSSYHSNNYFVDIDFSATPPGPVPTPTPSPTASPTPSPTASPTPSPTASPTPSPTASPTPSPTAPTTPSPTASPTPSPTAPTTPSTGGSLALPRIPWEGGPAYYRQFPGSSDFARPNVFPMGVWWGDFDSDANVKWDKATGITFYTQLNGTEDGRLLVANDMDVVQGANPSQLVKNLPFSDPHWAGWFLSDETDGRYDPPSTGQAQIRRQIDAQKKYCPSGACKAGYVNYTGIVTSYFNAAQVAADETYVNMVPGAVSVDGYYYTDPSCDDPGRHDYQINAPDNAHCRTAAAYGNFIDNLRTRDEADGKLQPLWGFVENGAPSGNGKYIQPEQMKAAVMSMIIHEARGIVWFNQSFSGSCQAGNVIRSAQAEPQGCNAARVAAMKQINTLVQSLAPVINTQSYAWDFRTGGADTMLKVKDGSAYIFSSVGLNKNPGAKSFTLPPGIAGRTVEVVGEGRTLPISGGSFTDTFPKESTFHVYKVSL